MVIYEGKIIGENTRQMRNREREFIEFSEEMLTLSNVKKALGLQERLLADARGRADELLFWSDKANDTGARIIMHLAWIDVLYKAFMLGYGASEIMAGNLSVGQWFSFWSAACSVTPIIPTIASVRQGGRPACPKSRRRRRRRRRRSAPDAAALLPHPESFSQVMTQYNGIQGALTLYLSIKARRLQTHSCASCGTRLNAGS